MKKLFAFSLLCLFLQCLKAQEGNFSETINHVFEHLDFTEVTTGLLLQRSIPLVRVDSFDGTALTDFNKMDVDKFGMLYATLFGAALDTASMLPHPDAYMDVREDLQPGDAIPLAIFHYDYHSLRDSAVSLNLLTVLDTQLYDVPNRSQSPYLLKKAFGVAPLKRYCDSLEMRFSLPTNSLFTNALGFILFEIDPDDGYGYQPLSFDDTLNVTYDEAGEKILKFRVTLSDSTVLVSHAHLEVRDGGSVNRDYGTTPDELIVIQGSGGNAGGTLQLLYDCPGNGGGGSGNGGGNGAWKPLLYIEGYEAQIGDDVKDIEFVMGENRFNKLIPGTSLTIKDMLDAQGYDILYLDFNYNGDYAENNAEVVKEALRIINQRKAMLSSHEKTVVIGASMGGVLGKYALRQMEIAEEDHDVKLFIALDAEFQGTNFPVGMQFMAAHGLQLSVIEVLGTLSLGLETFVPIIGDAQGATKAPFIQQMLLYNIFAGTSYIGGTIANNLSGADMTTAAFTDFQQELDDLGALEHCEFVAISNGALNGSEQGFGAGDKLLEGSVDVSSALTEYVGFFEENEWVADVTEAASWIFLKTGANAEFDVWALPDNPSNNIKVYEGKIYVAVLGLIPVIWTHFEGKVRETISYDNAPGGYLPIDLSKVPSFVNLLQPNICFVPTVSALDITTPENANLTLDLSDIATVVSSGLTLSDRYDGSTDVSQGSINQAHANLNPTNIPFLMAELTTTDNMVSLPTNGNGEKVLNDRTYNFGNADGLYDPSNPPPVWNTPTYLSHSMRVEDAGQLWVNRNDRIDFTDEHDNPANKQGNHFDLFLYGFSECEEVGSDLYIVDNGQMKIGHSSVFNTADVYVQSSTNVFIGGGGVVTMDDQSNFWVEDGGVVNIQAGGLFEAHYTSKTIVRDGGVFRVESGGILRMVDFSELLVEPGGQLILEDGAIVHLWDHNDPDGNANIHVQGELVINGSFEFDGSGYFQFDEDHTLSMGSGAEFKLVGKGKGTRFLKLNSGAVLNIGGSKLHLIDGEVQYEPLSSISIASGVIAYLKDVELNQLTNLATSDALEATEGAERVTIDGCTFNGFSYGVNVSDVQGTTLGNNTLYLRISECEFVDCELAVQAVNTPSVSISGSSFTTAESYSLFGLSLDNVNNAYVTSTSFSGFASEVGAVSLNDVADYNMIAGIVTDNTLGIKATGESNIDMRTGATVSENETGIKMEGGLSYGVLTMDCANLLDNGIGATGNDLMLNIDASGELKSNHFSNQSSQLLFKICYDDLAGIIGNQIDAKENLWEGTTAYRLYNQALPGFVSCSYSSGNVQLNMSPVVTEIDCGDSPDYPPSPGTPSGYFIGDDTSCRTNSSEILYDRYWDAYESYLTESYDTSSQRILSDSLYDEVASIADSTSAGYSQKCRQLIHIARSRVDFGSILYVMSSGNSSATGHASLNGKYLRLSNEQLVIKPNPTKEGFAIDTDPTLYRIEVFNAVGTLVMDGLYFGKEFVSTVDWTTGLYIVRLADAETNKSYFGKVSVNK